MINNIFLTLCILPFSLLIFSLHGIRALWFPDPESWPSYNFLFDRLSCSSVDPALRFDLLFFLVWLLVWVVLIPQSILSTSFDLGLYNLLEWWPPTRWFDCKFCRSNGQGRQPDGLSQLRNGGPRRDLYTLWPLWRYQLKPPEGRSDNNCW